MGLVWCQDGVGRLCPQAVMVEVEWGQIYYLPGIWGLVGGRILSSADFSSFSCSCTDVAILAEMERENFQPGVSGLFAFELVPAHPLLHLIPPNPSLWTLFKETVARQNQIQKFKAEGPF